MHVHVFPITGSVGTRMWRRTKDMELLTLSVLYIQGSGSGQKYFKI